MLQLWLQKVHEHFTQSPLRRLAEGGKDGIGHYVELSQYDSNLQSLTEGLFQKLSIVVMGEVKSGKSTIINALAGGAVSPTDVLEATATIFEIEHGIEAQATICYHDGRLSTQPLNEVIKLLEEHRNEETFFSTCRSVQVRVPLPRLERLRLVDTPGLATVTENNAKIAREYVQKADVVLWVFNGLHLGQSDVTQELCEVARLGKPVIGIINRMDQIEASPERVIAYIRRELGMYLQDVFVLSGEQAFIGVQQGNQELQEASGFTAICQYLEESIHASADKVKAASTASTAKALLRLDTAVHESSLREIDQLQLTVRKNADELRTQGERIAERIIQELLDRVHRELLTKEIQVIQAETKPSKEMVQNLLSQEKVADWWHEVATEIPQRLSAEWQASYEEYRTRLNAELKEFALSEQTSLLAFSEAEFDVVQDVVNTSLKGAAAGGAAGLGLAAWSAGIGPYAATVTFGAAASVFLLPVAFAGAIGGLGYGVMNILQRRERQKQDQFLALRDRISNIRAMFIKDFLEPKIFLEIKDACAKHAQKLHYEFISGFCQGRSLGELTQLQQEITTYLRAAALLELEAPNVDLQHYSIADSSRQ